MEVFAGRETPNRRVFQEKIFAFFRPMDTGVFHQVANGRKYALKIAVFGCRFSAFRPLNTEI